MQNKIKNWIKVYGLKNVILKVIYAKFPILPISSNEKLRRANWQFRFRNHLKKYITYSGNDNYRENEKSNKIWCLWFQGYDKAPDIVKKCYESIKDNLDCNKYELIQLNNDNLFDYVNLPNEIINKWKEGKIGNANFSDLCRISLLADYGGLWLDSTVYLSGNIDEEILESDMFFYKASFLDLTATGISSWMMWAQFPNEPYMCSLRDSLLNYWKENNHTEDYFIFHLMASLLGETNKLKNEYDSIPYFSNTYPLLLGSVLNDEYKEKDINHILKMSHIHKLSYKNINFSDYKNVYNYILKR